MKRAIGRLVLAACLVIAAGILVLNVPEPFFAWSVTNGNLALYSDTPFDAAAGRALLATVRAKLAVSPLFSAGETHRVFIVHSTWRKYLYLNYQYPRGAGGVNYYPITTNVFLRDGVIETNRLLTRAGKPVPGERTLDYFIAHEITHTLAGRVARFPGNHLLPAWIREGYPEYIARGRSFQYGETRRALLAGTLETWGPAKVPPYKRYCLLIACLIERNHWDARDVINTSLTEADVERAVRDERPIRPR